MILLSYCRKQSTWGREGGGEGKDKEFLEILLPTSLFSWIDYEGGGEKFLIKIGLWDEISRVVNFAKFIGGVWKFPLFSLLTV
jgi:hypothetical protein